MRVAIIDLGTNTFNLLITDVADKKFEVVYAGREVVKLGEKSINQNIIAEASYKRGIDALVKHSEVIKKSKVQLIKAFATSAIREAKNGKEFTDDIKKLTGIEVEVIDGQREAELIYYGNRLAVDMKDEVHLIMDIGGGSTEFIIANAEKIFWKQSFKLGVARLLEQFKPENPISIERKEEVNNYLAKELKPLLDTLQQYKITALVGSSGGFESVVDMVAASCNKQQVVPGTYSYPVDLTDYFVVSKETINSTEAERESMRGLVPMRRNLIVLTLLLIEFVLNRGGIKQFKVSTYALKEGALAEFIANNC